MEENMPTLTLEYWIDDGWYVGKLQEVPGVFSQGETLEELIDNIKDAYRMVLEENAFVPVRDLQIKKVSITL